MKLRRRHAPLLLCLLALTLPVQSRAGESGDRGSHAPAAKRAAVPPAIISAPAALPSTKANPVGTKDAPVDGKDGKPHDGPFVETGADRDRKKTKENGGEEKADGPFEGPFKESYSKLPKSNEGVMDDPNRLGPKDGTRGTEGGVSEKSGSKMAEKIPDAPKEAPPLPHSEEAKITDNEGASPLKVLEDEKKLLDVSEAVGDAR